MDGKGKPYVKIKTHMRHKFPLTVWDAPFNPAFRKNVTKNVTIFFARIPLGKWTPTA